MGTPISTAERFLVTARLRLRPLAALALVTALSGGCGGSRAIRPATDDSGISIRVRTALLNDTQVAANAINVTASNGVVTLSGRVRTPAERDRAVAVARQTSGVADVRSELAVEQP
jgi:hyperosmotically inducible periplasmic protein